jgi:hypothetical protein
MDENNQKIQKEKRQFRLYKGLKRRFKNKRLPKKKISASYRTRTRRYAGSEEHEKNRIVIMLRNVIISAGIILVVFLFKSIDTPFTNGVVDQLKAVITNDFDMDEAIGQLKFVGSFMPNIQAVFGEQNDRNALDTLKINESLGWEVNDPLFVAPAEGKVTSGFGSGRGKNGSDFSSGIEITNESNNWVYAAADGTVTAVTKVADYGNRIKLTHEKGIESHYTGCTDIQVSPGCAVKQGDQLARIARSASGKYVLFFEVVKDGYLVDPMSFIQEGYKTSQ